MGRTGKFTASDLKKLQRQLNKIQAEQADAFMESCAKELAARLLAKVIKRTPVGDYSKEIKVTAKRDSKKHKKGEVYSKRVNPSGKMGGTLRRGWTSQSPGSGSQGMQTGGAKAYADSLPIRRHGDFLVIEIVNPVEYTSYVEYGHRTASHSDWVPGRFMLTMSEQEIQEIAPKMLEARIKQFLEGCIR